MPTTYEIPTDIDSRIPEAFYYALAGKLFAVFGPELFNDHDGKYYDLQSGTAGWYEAFAAACRELNIDWLQDYSARLDWFNTDLFDGAIEERVIDKVIKNFEPANSYYQHLIDERNKHAKARKADKENNDELQKDVS